jgi:hypothetical protein
VQHLNGWFLWVASPDRVTVMASLLRTDLNQASSGDKEEQLANVNVQCAFILLKTHLARNGRSNTAEPSQNTSRTPMSHSVHRRSDLTPELTQEILADARA